MRGKPEIQIKSFHLFFYNSFRSISKNLQKSGLIGRSQTPLIYIIPKKTKIFSNLGTILRPLVQYELNIFKWASFAKLIVTDISLHVSMEPVHPCSRI